MKSETFIKNSYGLFFRTMANINEFKLVSGTECYRSRDEFKAALSKDTSVRGQELFKSISEAHDEDEFFHFGDRNLKVVTVIDDQVSWVDIANQMVRPHDIKGVSIEYAIDSCYEKPVKYIINKSGYFLKTSLPINENKLIDAQIFDTEDALEEADKEAKEAFIISVLKVDGELYLQGLNSCFGEPMSPELSVEDVINDYIV